MLKLILFMVFFIGISLLIQNYCLRRINQKSIKYNPRCDIANLDIESLIVLFLIALLPILLITYRSEFTGADTCNYIKHFELGEEYMIREAESSHEYLFWWIFTFFVRIGSIRFAFFTFAALTIYIAFISIYKLSIKYDSFLMAMLYLLLFFQDAFNIIRQMISISIIFLSITFIYERKIKAFLLCILIAALFHTSAVFCVPMYFLFSINEKNRCNFYKYKNYIIVILGTILFFYFPKIRVFIEEEMNFTRFSDLESSDAISNFLWLKSMVINIVIYVILIFLQKKPNKRWAKSDKKDFMFLWGLSIIFLISLALRAYINWIFRIGFYYEIGTIILAAKLCPNENRIIREGTLKLYRNHIVVLGYYVAYFFLLNYHNNFDSSALVNFYLAF